MFPFLRLLTGPFMLLPLLCQHINAESRSQRYQAVSQFYPGSNATILVKGDTVSGCKLVLLDRVRNKTCCFSTPEREESMCEPSIQSGGCRSLESVKVEEHPGYCKIILSEIKLEDTGRYMVIFPGNMSNHEEFEVKVEDKSDERLISGLPPISAISMFEEVQDFLPGTTATLSVPGYEAGSGCKFLFLDQAQNIACCYSATSRGDTLCNPDTQSSICRTKER